MRPRQLLVGLLAWTLLVVINLSYNVAVAMAEVPLASAAPVMTTYDAAGYAYDPPVRLSTLHAAAATVRGSPAGPGAVSWRGHVAVARFGVAANTAGGSVRSAVTSADVVTSPTALEGLTASQVDDLASNAGYEVLAGRAGAANPATRYYAPGTNRSVGFRVLPEGVAGQAGVKGGPYLRFFGGTNAGQRIPLGAS